MQKWRHFDSLISVLRTSLPVRSEGGLTTSRLGPLSGPRSEALAAVINVAAQLMIEVQDRANSPNTLITAARNHARI